MCCLFLFIATQVFGTSRHRMIRRRLVANAAVKRTSRRMQIREPHNAPSRCDSTAKTTAQFTYPQCNISGHRTENCPRSRKAGDREAKPEMACRLCKETGHVAAVCPTRKCKRCGKEGHRKRDCPEAFYIRCNELGHTEGVCTNCPPKCATCGFAHRTQDCIGGAKMKKPRTAIPGWYIPENGGNFGNDRSPAIIVLTPTPVKPSPSTTTMVAVTK